MLKVSTLFKNRVMIEMNFKVNSHKYALLKLKEDLWMELKILQVMMTWKVTKYKMNCSKMLKN